MVYIIVSVVFMVKVLVLEGKFKEVVKLINEYCFDDCNNFIKDEILREK